MLVPTIPCSSLTDVFHILGVLRDPNVYSIIIEGRMCRCDWLYLGTKYYAFSVRLGCGRNQLWTHSISMRQKDPFRLSVPRLAHRYEQRLNIECLN